MPKINLKYTFKLSDLTSDIPKSLENINLIISPNAVFQHIGDIRNCADVVTNLKGQSYSDFAAWTAFWHNIEAWSYLGRSLHSLKTGNLNSFIHLCYYSELRAALALFSLNGIFICEDGIVYEHKGVLKYNPFQDNSRRYLPSVHLGTHKVLWECFQLFKDDLPFHYYLQKMNFFSKDLESILNHVKPGTSSSSNIFLSELFKHASGDIFQKDRQARNRVSYFPFHDYDLTYWCNNIDERIKSIGSILNPSIDFSSIDLFILRKFLDVQYQTYNKGETYFEFLRDTFGEFFSTKEDYNETLINYITTESDIDLLLNKYCEHDPLITDYYKQIVSRTLIFLRLNMIHVKESIKDIKFSDLNTCHGNFFKNRNSDLEDITLIKEEFEHLINRIFNSELIKIAHLVE